MIWRKYQNIRELNRFKSEVGFSIGNMVDDTSMEAVNDAAQVGVADKGQIQGGIDLGNGDYLKVITTDAAGMPKFDPAQVQMLQKNLRGIIPVPVGMPQPVNLRPMLGLAPDSGKENIQVGSHKELSHEYLARRQDEVEQEVLL